MPFVINLFKASAGSPRILKGLWAAYATLIGQTTLPASLASMIGFAVSAANKCDYCNSLHTVACRTIGIDDDMLTAINSDLEALTPQRVQEIIRFAVKAATSPQDLVEADYERVRDQGISDEEIAEIVIVAAWATFTDRIADSLKIGIDVQVRQALAS